jgi:hypothetical protein
VRVQLDPGVFADPGLGRDVSAILDCCEQGQHQWVIDDLDEVLASAWMQAAASWDKELAEKTFRAAVDEPTGGGRSRLVLVVASAPASAGSPAMAGVVSCSAADARRILARPLYLVVENATSDWGFVRAVVATFDRTRLAQAIERHWLVPDQAGGSGELAKRARRLVDQGNAAWRIVVLMDSDRLAPGPVPNAVTQRIADLNALGASVITLHKREVENYLPGSLLDRERTHDAYVSWLTLSREQQDYFDVKYGFLRDEPTGAALVNDAQRALFEGTNPWHLKRLVGGFGRRIGEQLHDGPLDRDELTAVCETCPGELERALDTIEELL